MKKRCTLLLITPLLVSTCSFIAAAPASSATNHATLAGIDVSRLSSTAQQETQALLDRKPLSQLKASDQAAFVNKVVSTQQLLANLSNSQRAALVHQYQSVSGLTAQQAQQVVNDPALATIVPAAVEIHAVNTAASPVPGVTPSVVTNCRHDHPAMWMTWTAAAGNWVAKVKWDNDWCNDTWHVYPFPHLPYPYWSPAYFQTTNWCIGCGDFSSSHPSGDYFYTYNGHNYGGLYQRVEWQWKQCIGIGPLQQCLATHSGRWASDDYYDLSWLAHWS